MCFDEKTRKCYTERATNRLRIEGIKSILSEHEREVSGDRTMTNAIQYFKVRKASQKKENIIKAKGYSRPEFL